MEISEMVFVWGIMTMFVTGLSFDSIEYTAKKYGEVIAFITMIGLNILFWPFCLGVLICDWMRDEK